MLVVVFRIHNELLNRKVKKTFPDFTFSIENLKIIV